MFIGAPLFVPGYYPNFIYTPPPVIVPSSPPLYIEQSSPQPAPAAPAATAYWYWCESAQAYYPYVKECAEEWQQVVPQPPPPS